MEDNSTLVIILAAALAVSEAMALIPQLKDSGILQFIISMLKKILGKGEPKVGG